MKRLILLTLTLATVSAFAGEPSRYLVTTRVPAAKSRLRMVANSDEARRHDVRAFVNINAFGATLTEDEVEALRSSGDIVSVQPVVERHMSGDFPSIASDASQFVGQVTGWGVKAMHADQVWPVTRGSSSVNVAILDTGIDDGHPDLKRALAGQYNVYTRELKAVDDTESGHGTHVAGIIAAADNTIGTIGIAPDTKIWSVKVLNATGDGTDEGVALGLDWVISKKKELGGAWLVNFSLGAQRPSDVERAAVLRALDEGVVVIAAAGNRNMAAVDYPAAYEGVISVGALTQKLELAAFSSFGTGLVVTAPGIDIPSTVPQGRVKIAEVAIDGVWTNAYITTGSPFETVSAPLVACGYGRPEDFPANLTGKIAIMQRGGNVAFGEKARNAKLAGAAAAIIVNDDDVVHEQVWGWNLKTQICNENGCSIMPELDGFQFPVTVAMSQKEGSALFAKAGRTVVTVSARAEDYGFLGGTSMAAPHVTGTAALLLALNPALTQSQLEFALIATTADLLTPGWDMKTGYGAVDALAAAQFVAPQRFGIDNPQPRHWPRRRSSRTN